MDGKRRYGLLDFQRAFDEFFDDLLIDRWHCGVEARESARAQVVDLRDHYEVRIAVSGVNANEIEIEVAGQRLVVRVPSATGGAVESAFTFAESIDRDATTARCAEGILTIVVPKRRGRRVKLSET
jgi:HSP20 family molecular chaperone IbpA